MGSSEWLTRAVGHSDCRATLTAPGRRAESGGVSVSSSLWLWVTWRLGEEPLEDELCARACFVATAARPAKIAVPIAAPTARTFVATWMRRLLSSRWEAGVAFGHEQALGRIVDFVEGAVCASDGSATP